jgi:hypothetical protein
MLNALRYSQLLLCLKTATVASSQVLLRFKQPKYAKCSLAATYASSATTSALNASVMAVQLADGRRVCKNIGGESPHLKIASFTPRPCICNNSIYLIYAVLASVQLL